MVKYGCASNSFTTCMLGRPARASCPSTSYAMSGRSALVTPSITATPGPVSNARTPSICPCGGTTVMLPMPPRFCSPRQSDSEEKSIESAMGTSGAPCPPAATSRTRKSLTTSIWVRSAITAASPHCHVECPGSCQIVWPCDAMAAMSARATPASAITWIAASASQPPRSKLRRQYSAGVPPPRAALRRVRSAVVYGRE